MKKVIYISKRAKILKSLQNKASTTKDLYKELYRKEYINKKDSNLSREEREIQKKNMNIIQVYVYQFRTAKIPKIERIGMKNSFPVYLGIKDQSVEKGLYKKYLIELCDFLKTYLLPLIPKEKLAELPESSYLFIKKISEMIK